jgi:c-di-GMP-binding flagellar brake protein YcgR
MYSLSRPAPRRIVELPVELRFEGSTLRLFGESRNLSRTGMLVVAEDPKPPGTPIWLRLDEFEGRGEVVWRRESEEGALLGVRFTALTPQDRRAIDRILRDAPPFY